jgi:hypothetical protein
VEVGDKDWVCEGVFAWLGVEVTLAVWVALIDTLELPVDVEVTLGDRVALGVTEVLGDCVCVPLDDELSDCDEETDGVRVLVRV